MLQEKGDYRGADETFRKAIAMMREVNGQQSWTLAKMLANLGLLRADEGNYAEAEQLERQALQTPGNNLEGVKVRISIVADQPRRDSFHAKRSCRR